MLNHIATSLASNGWQVPIAVDNYAEFDPFTHPLEPDPEKSDSQTVDSGNIYATPDWSSGYFISIAANPYYPRFLASEYQNCFDCANTPDPFMGYVKQIRDYYPNSALLISEVGLSTSLVPSQKSSFFYNGIERTRNLGGYSEPDAGEVLANIIYKLFQERVNGVIIYELVDEWFKEDWNTKSLEKSSSDQYWKNVLDAGENRGLVSSDPFPSEDEAIVLDGTDKDWNQNTSDVTTWFTSPDINIRLSYDEAFMYIGLTKSNNLTWKFDSGRERLFIAFDTMPGGAKSGIGLLPTEVVLQSL